MAIQHNGGKAAQQWENSITMAKSPNCGNATVQQWQGSITVTKQPTKGNVAYIHYTYITQAHIHTYIHTYTHTYIHTYITQASDLSLGGTISPHAVINK